ncbi:uncharacterized protein HKW66_Vig0121220 [Vigna angularis]|uniref:Uncharacterized protein n=1 Tax=Phaseolus angularis TaxID=3914 RepID=A0A8T0JZG4_PHAAN|nr:uncharacterized protein HKW66_Vig0121220 [Vigna angularis]
MEKIEIRSIGVIMAVMILSVLLQLNQRISFCAIPGVKSNVWKNQFLKKIV